MELMRKWNGYWINTGKLMGAPSETVGFAPYLRKTFECTKRPVKATVYLCGLGWHELYVNGKKVDDRVLAPVVTQFDKRVSYIAYDVAKYLKKGENAIAVLLGNGWYNCHTKEVWSFDKAPWRDWPKLLCDVVVDDELVAKSDTTWKFHDSPVVFDSLRNGETYDARLELPGFSEAGFDDSAWINAKQCNPPGGLIVEEDADPCKVQKIYPSVAKYPLSCDYDVYDFGVNLTGWCRITVKGEPGTKVCIRYSELIRPTSKDTDREYIEMFVKSGEFQTDEYRLKGEGVEVWEPHFTYHGFRYAKVVCCGNVKVKKIEACFVHNSFPRIGMFESSDSILNALQRNTVQSYLSNFTGIPTDCPHREKNGWTGDAQLAMETGLWNFNAEKSCSHFLRLLVDTQRPSGQLPGIAPTGGWGFNWGSGPAWDSLLFEYPWRMYLFRGNTENIREHYDAMARYLEYCKGMSEEYFIRFGLGDWCHPYRDRSAPVEVTSTGYYYYDVTRMIEFAGILGKKEDVAAYSELAQSIRKNFNARYFHKDGSYADGSWTAQAAALYFGLAEEKNAAKIAENLVKKVRANAHRADFGILGAKYVPRVLSDYGYADDAFLLITQPEYPGWGYSIRNGATSLWEHWSGVSSENHIMFGDISAWMYEYAAGVSPLKETPGFKHFRIKPEFISALSHVKMCHESLYGLIRSEWKRKKNKIECEFEIPEGSTADLYLPGDVRENVSGIIKVTV